jgi:hypothetical protein
MRTPPSPQLRHWMNHTSRGTSMLCMNFPNYARRIKVVLSVPGVTSSTHEFQMLRNHANSETPLLVQLAVDMILPRVACVTLLLNLTPPLARRHRCIDLTRANMRTSNHKPFRQSNSAAEMTLLLPWLACMKFSAPRVDRTLSMDLPLV